MKPIAIKTIANKSIIGKTILGLVALLALLVCCEVSVAQKPQEQSRVEAYLKNKDVNGNGKIEPEEMSERTKKFVSKMGFDPSKNLSISKIVDKADKADRAGKHRAAGKKLVALKVPGFGVIDESSEGVKAFSAHSFSFNSGKVSKTYSESDLRLAARTLSSNDRNRDGVLDASEINRTRWGSPSPLISNLNKDGRLTRNELNERYAAREKSRAEFSKSRSSSAGRGQNKKGDRSKISNSRGRSEESYGTRRDDSNSRSSSSKNSSSQFVASKAKVNKAKYLKYSRSLIKNYDKDKDGRLSKAEAKKMRRPLVGADTNDDGFVSESELVESLISTDNGRKNGSKSENDDSKSFSSKSEKTSYRSGDSSSNRNSRVSPALSKLDSDGDNQVQMHEFSDTWDEDTVAEFYEKDTNGDGVITAAEWVSRD